MTTPHLCVLDTCVASDVQAAGLWVEVSRLDIVFVVPQVVAVTEFRADDILAAKDTGILVDSLSDDEELRTAALVTAYRRPSSNDLAALALARARGATLLTGDGPLRDAATAESVPIHGVLWLLDQLVEFAIVAPSRAAAALQSMLDDGSRLPPGECRRRLRSWRT
jgi:predicted nucleic acid-binding protein